jgi:hypothetical protein
MRGVDAHADHVRQGQCPRCYAPVLPALAGRVAALDVHADAWSVAPGAEERLWAQGRLTWCVTTMTNGQQRLLWRGPEHRASGCCAHLVVADHVCAQPRPFATNNGRY